MPRIEGLTIEIGADAKRFSSEIRGMDKSLAKTKRELTSVNRALHFNPGNTDLIKQKQQLLAKSIDETKNKLKRLKAEEEKLKSADGFDENSEDAKKLRREIIETESKLKSLERTAAKTSSVLGQKMQVAGDKMQKLGSSISRTGDMLTTRLTLPIVAMAGVAAKKFAEVDKTMQLTNATMGNTEQEARLISDAMKDAAANSTFTMNDAATASLNFARAGLDAAQAASTLAPAMNLAAGEGGNLDTVSGGLVATINGFHGSFDDAAHYADVFANACNNSALDVDSLSEAMSVAAPVFAAAGYKVEDAALYMGVMANNGIKADKAANSLKTGISRLVKPTDEAAGWLEKLGIQITNNDGTMKDTVTIQKELHDSFKGLSEAEQIAAASAIFGKNQMSPWLALINAAPDDVRKLSRELQVEGTTAEMAEKMMGGFGGAMEKLKSSVDVAATSLGEALAPKIRAASDRIQEAVDSFNRMSDAEKDSVVKTGLLVAALGPVLSITGRLLTGIGRLTSGLGQTVTTMTSLAKGTATIGTAFGAAAAGALAFVGIAYAVSKVTQAQLEKEVAFNKEQKEHFKALEDTTRAYKEAKTARDQAVTDINGEYGLIENLKNEYNGLIDSNGKVKEGYEARAEYIKGELAEALGLEKSELDQLIDKNGKLKGKIDDVIASQKAQAILEANKDLYTQALESQRKAAEKLGPALKDLEDKKKQEAEAHKEYARLQEEYNNQEARGRATKATNAELESARAKWYALNEEVAKGEKTVKDYTNTLAETKSEIARYEGLTKAIADKDSAAIQQWTTEWTEGIKTRKTATQDELTEQAKIIDQEYQAILQAYNDGELHVSKDIVEQAKKRRDEANKEAGLATKDAEKNAKAQADATAKGLNSGKQELKKIWDTFTGQSAKASNAMKNDAAKGSESAKKSIISNLGTAAVNGVKSFAKISSGASTQMGAAKKAVDNNAGSIKKKFPISVGKAMSGYFNLPNITATITKVAGAVFPTFSKLASKVFHFAKAYDNPMLFTSPTLYNGAVVGDRGAHAGGEMIYGKDNLMRDIQQAVGGMQTVINVTVNGAESPEDWADRFIREYQLKARTV